MNAFSGVEYLPMHPMASPISVVDIFFPGFSTLNASAQQLLLNNANGYVRLLCMGAVFAIFARYVYGYANELINKHFSPTIHVYYYDEAYEMIKYWVQQQPFAKEVASLMVRVKTRTVVQDQLLRKKPLSYSPWDGSFGFWYKNHWLTLHCHKREHHEEISISCIGTSPKILMDLMKECREQYLSLIQRKVPVFQPEGGEWKRTGLRPARDISTVIMDEEVKKNVLEDMRQFLDEQTQEWYTSRGIPYKRGYLLDGPPGTGKSSFCLSVAGVYELDIYILNLSSLGDAGLSKLFTQLPPRCIVLLEDVDAVGLDRKNTSVGQNQKDAPQRGVSLSGLLNVIDGVGSQEGRILIMSTNHIDHLDEALIRPGRVDKTILFKRADNKIVTQLFCTIFKRTPTGYEQPKKEIDDLAIERLAEEFAAHVPEEEFSPAKVLSFLLEHKNSPADAVSGVHEWEEQRRRKEAKRRQEIAERNLNLEILQTRNTTLPEFLDACHEHLFLGLTIQKDKKSSTKGDAANADRKLRPSRIQEWVDFPDEQTAIWKDLMDEDFVTERHFTPLLAPKEYVKEVTERMLSSELDLGYFQRHSVESRVASAIKQLHANPQLQRRFHLNGDVTFENHANTLTDESRIVTNMNSLSLEQEGLRRSERLARRSRDTSRSTSRMRRQATAQPRLPRPRADQFCVYNRGPDEKVPSFLIEYKAPRKLSLAHIKAGLQDMELDHIVRYQKDESPEDICRRVVAAVITQLSHYMYEGGNEYGCVVPGEAFIFLRVLYSNSSTVLYYLSVPQEDVGNTTGWAGDVNGDNRLHLTAVGQLLAFTLRALRTSPRDIAWRDWVASQLETWEMVYDDLLEKIEEKDIPASDYKPPLSRTNYCRQSPVRTRSKSVMAISCDPSQESRLSDHEYDTDDSLDPSTPSRAPRDSRFPQRQATAATTRISTRSQHSSSKGKSRKYCTQQCLRSLRWRGPLDRKCPNASEHGVDRHRLNTKMAIKLLDRQLSNDPDPNSELGCESLHVHGIRGALFKITLWSHGYTFVGKGGPVEFIECAKREEMMYSHLSAIQGQFVPVVLGGLNLRRPLSYDGIAKMVHLTLMSYAGRNLAKRHESDHAHLIQQAETSLRAIHELGILHNDPIPGNMIWNEENKRVMFIDFERAQYQKRMH
ncbi:metalloprotease m41 ftsh, putative [Talaromyces stipitatus ATCC 10500]|uniref:Metalloprotease m41 ftsh, putative n=1 Tax=Talaromyces stipitatus (strain ATCC 10500 / CBS 375.48 / QM 6759 / NRRL 1006) TaxID=441959 RepID=B8MPP7_TALSN|nr:metalloprotease m41 ftsh, putative [Talaromyces stipitatus ATCC 10500]EED14486.1 metalloprotease m41 ftsh, putative [Talaromyces stipitatus ATCC 10500]